MPYADTRMATAAMHTEPHVREHLRLPVAVGLAVAGFVLGRVDFPLRNRPLAATKPVYEWYLELRIVLQRVLAVEGAILGAAILATGSLRNSVVVWHHNDATAFPREFVLMYGGFFTLLLALLYAPVYQTLLETGRKLVEGAC